MSLRGRGVPSSVEIDCALVGGSTDNGPALQAAINALDQNYGGTIRLPFRGGNFYVATTVTLPRLGQVGQIHIDLNGCTLWTDQGIAIFQCLVPRNYGADPVPLLAGTVDWEIRNGHLLSSNAAAGSRGIHIEASYNLRFRGIHFDGFEVGEETRFGLMHSDEDCRYTNCTLVGAYHGSGEACGTTDASTVTSGATITVPTTMGFDGSGQVTFYTGQNRGGPQCVISYTGKTATTFTGCSVVSGSSPAPAGSHYVQTLWAGASTSDGCNASRHHARHYCPAGAQAALAVHCTDGQVIAPGSVFEGGNPKYNIHYDGGGLSVVNSITVDGAVHIENVASGSAVKLNGQGLAVLQGINHQAVALIVDPANLFGTVLLRDTSLFSAGSTVSAGAADWLIEGSGSRWDPLSTANWTGGTLPSVLQVLGRNIGGNNTALIQLLRTLDIYNAATGTQIVGITSGDKLYLFGSGVQINPQGGLGLGFWGVGGPGAQPSRVGQVTDNTGGTSEGNAVAAAGAAYSQTDENNFRATVIAKLNALEAIFHSYGLTA